MIRRLADYRQVSSILWIGLGILQVLAVVTIFAGVWNITAGIGRLGSSNRIRARDPHVVEEFEGVGSLVVIAIINLIFGAFIGVALIGIDFYVRDKVLSNRHLFGEQNQP